MSSSTYITELPYLIQLEICKILNKDDKWKKIAELMKFDNETTQDLASKSNPTNELFNLWRNCNRTVLELFILLYNIQNRESMELLRSFVDEKYHVLLNALRNNMIEINVLQNTHQQNNKLNDKLNKPNNLSKSILDSFSSTLPKIPFNDLALATNNWEKKNCIGKGGFASVYKGKWKNTEVAVKKINNKNSNDDNEKTIYNLQLEQSFREIQFLSSLTHKNILALYGYSIDGPDPCLVYEYMENGSLEDRIKLKDNTAPLTWFQRGEIAKGIALGLQYLHTAHEKPIIHQDIKSANILLDTNFVPKIGDFGLVKEGFTGSFMKVDRIQGTRGYLPEDYICSKKLSTKVDTYSFGIVLLEMATGMTAFDRYTIVRKSLPAYVNSFNESDQNELKDKKAGEADTHIFSLLIKYGIWCTRWSAANRPEMEVLYKKINNELGPAE